jgi:hypothetical protein
MAGMTKDRYDLQIRSNIMEGREKIADSNAVRLTEPAATTAFFSNAHDFSMHFQMTWVKLIHFPRPETLRRSSRNPGAPAA